MDARLCKNCIYYRFFSFVFIAISFSFSAAASLIEDYGMLPAIRSLTISPDGRHYAYIKRSGESDYFVIMNIAAKKVVEKFSAGNIKARSISFATNKHVIIFASQAQIDLDYSGQWEHSAAISYNIETKKNGLLLKGTKHLHPAQSGLGRIVGVNEEENVVYMPAFGGDSRPKYHLYKVNLDTGRGVIHAKGKSYTEDWFVGNDGEAIVREDYVNLKKEHRVYSKASGQWKQIYSLKTPVPRIGLRAISDDGTKLLFVQTNNNRKALYSMRLTDGEIEGPILGRDNADIQHLHTTINRHLKAVTYSGFKPDYQRLDDLDPAIFGRLASTFPNSSVSFESETADLKKIVIKVSGADAAGAYLLLDTETVHLELLTSEYPAVKDIGSMKGITYISRDELKIPAIITFPTAKEKQKNLPMIVLPHGGPEDYDYLKFDWMAQFFSRKGYLVLQPNYRGSTGFGYDFLMAGRGKWGKEMQNDISDGVYAMVTAGYADPDRVCIIGTSYGGYSALAGGAFSPELYRCIVSVNGVSDLPVMLSDDRRKYRSKHFVINYWREVVGFSKGETNKLKEISPVNFADKFTAPVLLIHGKEDTVVPIRQSRMMEKALKKSGKNIAFVTLDREDHWLSTSAARLATLQAIDDFLEKYNPSD